MRQEDYQFEHNLGYLVRPCLKDEEKVSKISALQDCMIICHGSRGLHFGGLLSWSSEVQANGVSSLLF